MSDDKPPQDVLPIPDALSVATSVSPPAAPASEPEEDLPRISLLPLSAIALLVGLITGLGAVVFRDLIGLVHNILFLGKFAVAYNASLFTPADPWGAWVILVPSSVAWA
jgi:CIC family chloride channel protein